MCIRDRYTNGEVSVFCDLYFLSEQEAIAFVEIDQPNAGTGCSCQFRLYGVAYQESFFRIGRDCDGKRTAVADFIMLYGIFNQHLYGHGGKQILFGIMSYIDLESQIIFKTHFKEKDVG